MVCAGIKNRRQLSCAARRFFAYAAILGIAVAAVVGGAGVAGAVFACFRAAGCLHNGRPSAGPVRVAQAAAIRVQGVAGTTSTGVHSRCGGRLWTLRYPRVAAFCSL